MFQILIQPSAQRIAWTLVHFLWQGIVLGLLAWGLLELLRRRSAQTRYLVACGFLLACLAAPVTTFVSLAPPPVVSQTLPSLRAQSPPTAAGALSYRGQAPSPIAAWSSSLRTRLQPVLPWVLGCWLVGVGCFSLRSIGGWIWLQRMKAEATPIEDPEWCERLLQMAQQIVVSRAVRFRESSRIASPIATGLLRPVIMIPLQFFACLDPLAVEAVLAHELAHIRRMDVMVNGIQCMIETLFFFHPAVWWISRRIRIEREHCCDDVAVQVCGDPLLMAETLNRLDSLRALPMTLVPGATGGSLMERIRRLVAPDPQPLRFTGPSLSMGMALCMGMTVLAGQQEPVKHSLRELSGRLLQVVGSRQRSESGTPAVPGEAPCRLREAFIPPAVMVVPSMTHRSHGAPPLPQFATGSVPSHMITPGPEDTQVHAVVIQEEDPGGPQLVSKNRVVSKTLVEIMGKDDPMEPGNGRWPEGVSSMEAASLPFSSAMPLYEGKGETNAYRILRVNLQPGERAVFRMQAEDSKVVMEVKVPHEVPSLAWRLALQNANFPPAASRASRLEVKNPTQTAQDLDLLLYGVHGYSYHIELARKR